MMNVGWLKAPISFGAMASFYSLALSCMNSGARILYPMGKLGVFHSSIGTSHETNETPHVAVTVMSILIFLSHRHSDPGVQARNSRRLQRRRNIRRLRLSRGLLSDLDCGPGISQQTP